jgi:hypothetical protein
MKRLPTICLILLELLLIPSFQSLSTVRGETEDVNYFIKSTVTYTNPSGNTNVWSFSEDDRTINLFMNNNWQTVELVNSTFTVEEPKNDDDGNSVAVLQFPKLMLSQGENVSFTVWYHIISKPRTMPNIIESESRDLTNIPLPLVDEYTREEGPWQTNDPTLQGLASTLKGSQINVLTIIKNFIMWIKINIKYPSPQAPHENPYYPNQTYAQREGDCDDQAILLITLCRIVGIPSYLQIGSIYRPNQLDNSTFWDGRVSIVERQIAWHGWAVVYIPPWGWLPVDLTYVPEGFGDPLNAIKYGAVTGQDTIQYMNVTHTDYVASSLEDRKFLTENGFDVYEEDEMILEGGNQKLPLTITVDPWVPLVFIVLIVFFVVTPLIFFRQWTREDVRRGTDSED